VYVLDEKRVGSCVIPPKLIVDIKTFRGALKMVLNEDYATLKIISELVRKLKRKTWYTVKYEDLLGNDKKVIQDL